MVSSDPIQNVIDQQGFVVLDGALATEMEARGATLNDPLWSAKLLKENPALIRQVHYEYYKNGADIATTASYQATFEGFAKRGWNRKQAIALFQLGVQLANEARDQFWQETNHQIRVWPLIAASVGPYGAMLADGSEYRGNYGLSVRALMDFHRPRLEVLMESGAELLACETIPSILEAEALIRLLEEYQEVWAWISFSCADEKHLGDGTTFREVLELVSHSLQIVAAGINCTAPDLISPLLESVKNYNTKPFIIYPNSGEGWDADRKCWLEDAGPINWEKRIPGWHKKGVRIFGGCCRTSPEDITRIRAILGKLS